jgi:quinol monooxygenase YgiN
MVTRIVTVQIKPGQLEEAVRIFQDSILPAARQQPGFKSLTLLTDPATGKAMSVGHWSTEADLKASETNGFLQEQFAKFAQVIAAPPVREVFQISAQS